MSLKRKIIEATLSGLVLLLARDTGFAVESGLYTIRLQGDSYVSNAYTDGMLQGDRTSNEVHVSRLGAPRLENSNGIWRIENQGYNIHTITLNIDGRCLAITNDETEDYRDGNSKFVRLVHPNGLAGHHHLWHIAYNAELQSYKITMDTETWPEFNGGFLALHDYYTRDRRNPRDCNHVLAHVRRAYRGTQLHGLNWRLEAIEVNHEVNALPLVSARGANYPVRDRSSALWLPVGGIVLGVIAYNASGSTPFFAQDFVYYTSAAAILMVGVGIYNCCSASSINVHGNPVHIRGSIYG